jgi:hypothetical protein
VPRDKPIWAAVRGAARSSVAEAGRPISTLYLERIGPVFDREASALFDHDLMGRDRRPRRLGGLHLARNFRPVVRLPLNRHTRLIFDAGEMLDNALAVSGSCVDPVGEMRARYSHPSPLSSTFPQPVMFL